MYYRRLLSLLVLALPLVAEPLTPEAVTRLALQNDPNLAAARTVVAEAEARVSGLGRLPNPDLETEFAAGSRERGRFEVGVSQAFPRTSRLRLERRVAAEAVTLARLEIAVAEAGAVARARSALVELAAAEASLALARSQSELAHEFAEARQREASAGRISMLDAAQAALAAREAELSVAESRAGRSAAALALSTALGREADAELSSALDLALPAEPPAPGGLGSRPELALAEAAIAAGEAELSLARVQGREDYRVGVFAEGEQDRAEAGARERELKIGLRFSVPLPVRNVSAPAVAEKHAARRRLALERDALALALRNEAAAAAAALVARHSAARSVAADLLPAARAHLAATEAAFGRGEIEMDQVFRARERLAEIERSDLAARRAYHLAFVSHQAAAGRLLP